MTADVQLDLFGEAEGRLREAERAAAGLAAWRALFERAEWVAPWDTQGGLKAGESVLGWRCPDPACGEVEPYESCLSINHGWDPGMPGWRPFDGRCTKLGLLAAQAASRARAGQGPR